MALPPEKTPIVAPRQKPIDDDVMSVMKDESSKMKVDAIIDGYMAKNHPNVNVQQFKANLKKMMRTPNVRMLRYSNTLGIVIRFEDQPKVCEVHLISMDKPKQIIAAIKDITNALKKAGYEKIVTHVSDQSTLRMMDAAGINYTATMSQAKSGGAFSPAYKVEVTL